LVERVALVVPAPSSSQAPTPPSPRTDSRKGQMEGSQYGVSSSSQLKPPKARNHAFQVSALQSGGGVLSLKSESVVIGGQSCLPRTFNMMANTIISTPQRVPNSGSVLVGSPFPHTPTMVAQSCPPQVTEWTPGDTLCAGDSSSKRLKKGDKNGKGLRHFSMKVCEKVQQKGTTSYNEVADELVAEFTHTSSLMATDSQVYDQKNIRRRVYDALNVLMAMNIISKEKKEIRWIGLPTNSAQECQNLEQIAFKSLVQRNQANEALSQAPPPPGSVIQLPFIILNTSVHTVIDCSISNDKCEYLFNFDNSFEIHDDIEILKRMGMSLGLESMATGTTNASSLSGLCGDQDASSLCGGQSRSLSSTAASHASESRGQTPSSFNEDEEEDEDDEPSSPE
ncbi:hypothetical protein JZ751_001941, partial [Albula glossodonta]